MVNLALLLLISRLEYQKKLLHYCTQVDTISEKHIGPLRETLKAALVRQCIALAMPYFFLF